MKYISAFSIWSFAFGNRSFTFKIIYTLTIRLKVPVSTMPCFTLCSVRGPCLLHTSTTTHFKWISCHQLYWTMKERLTVQEYKKWGCEVQFNEGKCVNIIIIITIILFMYCNTWNDLSNKRNISNLLCLLSYIILIQSSHEFGYCWITEPPTLSTTLWVQAWCLYGIMSNRGWGENMWWSSKRKWV